MNENIYPNDSSQNIQNRTSHKHMWKFKNIIFYL
jgi:hypothetical protein